MKKLLAVAFVVFSSAAWAQSGELWFDAGESLISNGGLGTDQVFGGSPNDVELTNGFRFGFRFGINTAGHFGHEIQYAYSRTQLKYNDQGGIEQGMAIHQGGYNFLAYATSEGSRIRPFGTGGVGFSNYVPPGSSATSGGGSTKFGFSYGGGVKVRVTDLWAVRFDLRQYTTPKPFDLPLKSGWIRQTEVSAGIGIMF
jgi:opacity protein-like surface antigen